MIKTLSPYYITIPWEAPSEEIATSVTIKVYVWNGDKSNIPDEPIYIQTKDNITNSEGSIKINIANWIADFISLDIQPLTVNTLADGNNQQWVRWETYYETTDEYDGLIPSNINTKLFSNGYSYGMEGENVEVNTGFLIPINEYKVAKNSTFTIPYLIEETEVTTPTFAINISNIVDEGDNEYSVTFSLTGYFDTVIFVFVRDNADEDEEVLEVGTIPYLVTQLEDTANYVSAYMKGINNEWGVIVESNIYTL